jgi:hypothetical protein
VHIKGRIGKRAGAEIYKRARSYMLTYKPLEFADKNNGGDENKTNITLIKTESMKEVLKSHHAVLDFDKHLVVNSTTADGFSFGEDLELMKRWGGRERGVGEGLV